MNITQDIIQSLIIEALENPEASIAELMRLAEEGLISSDQLNKALLQIEENQQEGKSRTSGERERGLSM
jgi:hypothetical protein